MFSFSRVFLRSGMRALAIASVVAAVSISGVAADNGKNFHGTVNETFTAVACPAPSSPTLFCAQSNGSGQMSHVGQVTSSFLGIVDFAQSPAPGCYIETSTGTLTSANGDQVFVADNNGTFCLTSATSGSVTGTFSVTGGTGRFSAATGSGNYSASTVFNSTMTGGSSAETYDGSVSMH